MSIKINKLLTSIAAALLINASLAAFELPISTQLGLDGQLGVKLEHPADESYGKGLPLGPSSVRFFDGKLWVSDTLNHRMMEFRTDGTFIRAVDLTSAPTANPGDFYLTKDQNGKLNFWICDEDNASVSLFDESGKCLNSVGTMESDVFRCPHLIEQLPSGNMLILDWGKEQMIELSKSLKVIGKAKVFARTMLLQEDQLLYFSLKDDKPILNKRNLTTGAVNSVPLKLSADPEPDLLAYDKKGVIAFGLREDPIDGFPQYRLMRLPVKEINMPTAALAYPPPFAVRPMIRDEAGKYYNYYLDTIGKTPLLKLEPVNLDFSLKDSEG